MATGPSRRTSPRSRTYWRSSAGNRLGGGSAAQQRLDDAPDALLLELVRELIEVRLAARDEPLPRVTDGVGRDRPGAVPAGRVPEAGVVGQGVDQPGLPAGQLPDLVPGARGERLARRLGVLGEQRQNLVVREVAQAQRLGLHVERAAAGDDRLLGARPDAVVAHVPHAAQDDALRKGRRAPDVARSQLAQHREQRIAHQRVDLVDEQHRRPRVGLRPAAQRLAKGAVRTGRREDGGPGFVEGAVLERRPHPGCQLAQDGAHRLFHVLARGLGGLDVHVRAAVPAAAVELVPQRQQRGGLAGLPGRMQDEVHLLPDEPQDLLQVESRQRWDPVVVLRPDGTGGVEEAHAASIPPAPPPGVSGRRLNRRQPAPRGGNGAQPTRPHADVSLDGGAGQRRWGRCGGPPDSRIATGSDDPRGAPRGDGLRRVAELGEDGVACARRPRGWRPCAAPRRRGWPAAGWPGADRRSTAPRASGRGPGAGGARRAAGRSSCGRWRSARHRAGPRSLPR